MKRSGWKAKLRNLITERASAPFVWGKNDCVLWAGDCYKAISGGDPVAEFRDAYDNEQGAKKAIVDYCGGNLTDAVLQMLGYPNQKKLEDGDIVMVQLAEGDTMGVYADGRAIVVGEKGLIEIPATQIVAHWRV